MRRANAHSQNLTRRRLLTSGAAVLLFSSSPVFAQEKKKKSESPSPIERPPVNNPVLVIDAVTAPVAAPPGKAPGTVIMTLSVDCGSVENARVVDTLIPRVYNAIILELNREPLGKDGRVNDHDLAGVKQRLLHQINRALQGPQVVGVYIRSLQEVPRR